MVTVFCDAVHHPDFLSIGISVIALVLSYLAFSENLKGTQFQRFLMFVEKESSYASEFQEQKAKRDQRILPDKLYQYINLFEAIALCYNNKEVPQKIVEGYFKTVLTGTYKSYKQEIDEKISQGDYIELNKLLRQWNLK